MNIVVYAALLFAVSEIILTAVQFALRKRKYAPEPEPESLPQKLLSRLFLPCLYWRVPLYSAPCSLF